MRRFLRLAGATLASAALGLGGPAAAQNRVLTIGAQSAPSAMDPHFHSSNNNNAILRQVFNPLVDFNTRGELVPALAESWRAVDDLTWEFRLREGVRFHDGTPFEADDIAFTFARVPTVPNSPGPFTPFVRTVAGVEVVDGRTVRITTKEPNPFLDWDLSLVMMLSRRLHANATTADFNSGRAMIGTGAYRHVSYALGERHEMARNPDYWGGAVPWERVVMRFIPNAGARVATLLSGDVDLIDFVPTQDVARLSADPRMAVFGVDSQGTAYLFPDAARDQAPFVSDKQGRPLERNPLRDRRVRQALSMAINRGAIVERLLSGQGSPAEQFAAPSVGDRVPDMPPLPQDIDRARRLLAEAGYPDGFRLTLHGPNGWFAGDSDVLQAIAQGFTRIGVETRVEVLPPANFFTRATNRDFALFMTTYTSSIAANTLRQVVMTKNPATGAGPFNRQHYSNPAVDQPLAEALRTMDPARRRDLTAQAMRATIEDMGVIPVFYLKVNWAGQRARVRYDPSPAWYTNALLATPAE
ncbi:ABC transporter substrate-binding protein [Siccirubricoccus sp. G192]|uniref:ABC transporter substrate-binding protein n=1 Tax=Siccirubricoccus sp. G192 TaxID=2849651 RepID=UPI001C2C9D25|nr:ABC transporter substrate-binding protein [Siccirubricoccus sp. G192]MBV1797638.1 ABC transporter substrate-binding protein [Siccirubricoccus sp. G192]